MDAPVNTLGHIFINQSVSFILQVLLTDVDRCWHFAIPKERRRHSSVIPLFYVHVLCSWFMFMFYVHVLCSCFMFMFYVYHWEITTICFVQFNYECREEFIKKTSWQSILKCLLQMSALHRGTTVTFRTIDWNHWTALKIFRIQKEKFFILFYQIYFLQCDVKFAFSWKRLLK